MGVHDNIAADKFPKQGEFLNRRTEVCFNYDSSVTFGGVFVRDDDEAPHISIIRLDDGRHVLATECQYRPPFDKPPVGRA